MEYIDGKSLDITDGYDTENNVKALAKDHARKSHQ